jgi:hypothetical protein
MGRRELIAMRDLRLGHSRRGLKTVKAIVIIVVVLAIAVAMTLAILKRWEHDKIQTLVDLNPSAVLNLQCQTRLMEIDGRDELIFLCELSNPTEYTLRLEYPAVMFSVDSKDKGRRFIRRLDWAIVDSLHDAITRQFIGLHMSYEVLALAPLSTTRIEAFLPEVFKFHDLLPYSNEGTVEGMVDVSTLRSRQIRSNNFLFQAPKDASLVSFTLPSSAEKAE